MHGIQLLYLYKSAGNNGDDSSKYSIQKGYSNIITLETAGNNSILYKPGGTKWRPTAVFDTQCKICDMAGGVAEWSTETSSYNSSYCVERGGSTNANYGFSATRNVYGPSIAANFTGFRLILYL